ncbi:hypothetical protein G7B40_003565 [Aetokthonos hydrillicola Thurmond2011]|uniref:Uncharacterized protein n=1 Tax=Aetokthonos hydrillicola Thurmond2011 TaxID=2712845 RepID=A0AAP5M608_9CYAN|nr:hypothetical protein [Aetokthonos hydrillicola]MDR9893660.1 hypothetical protein [Aetokthonos hydrillicola Thurmond2011]
MGRKDKVSSKPSLSVAKGYKLVDLVLPLGSEIAGMGKDYQDLYTEIAHHLHPRWTDTP